MFHVASVMDIRGTLMPSIPRTPLGSDRATERERLIAWRKLFSGAQRSQAERAIGARLVALLQGQPAGVLAVYWPIRGEPDLGPELTLLERRGMALALPRVRARGQALEFGMWRPGQAMRPGGYGVMLPEPFELVRPDTIVMPCVGFSASGYRLGYGAGFYDLTLAQFAVPAIGVAFDGLELDGFKPQPHDQRLTHLVTESRTLAFQ
jgi:5-formyltetrahydrofolate cyclo-ligase